MKNLISQQQGYNRVENFVMLTSLLSLPMRSNLRAVQVDELNILDKKYTRKITLNSNEVNYLKTLYQNFVLNNFKFEDKQIKIIKKVKITKPLHVGLQMLNKL